MSDFGNSVWLSKSRINIVSLSLTSSTAISCWTTSRICPDRGYGRQIEQDRFTVYLKGEVLFSRQTEYDHLKNWTILGKAQDPHGSHHKATIAISPKEHAQKSNEVERNT